MLKRTASARNGERITSITTDVRFFVVFVFIRLFARPDATLCCFATNITCTTRVPVVQTDEERAFARFVSSACSLWLTTAVGPLGGSAVGWGIKLRNCW